MTPHNNVDIITKLSQIVENVVHEPVSINASTDLIKDGILDSLDGMIFILEVEAGFGKSFPEDINLVDEGYYRIDKLVDFLTTTDG